MFSLEESKQIVYIHFKKAEFWANIQLCIFFDCQNSVRFFPNRHAVPQQRLRVFPETSYRPPFLATQCLPDWHWCQAHRGPDTLALWRELRRMCWRRLSVCGPWSVHMERRCQCCQLERGDEEVEGPASKLGNPSAQRQKGNKLG